MKPVLVLKFPLSSAYGGGERHTLRLFEEAARRGGRFAFVGSCSVLLREFRARRWPAIRWWAGREPVTPAALLVFPLVAPFVLASLAAALLYGRLVIGARVLYCLSLTEKVLAAPLARALGMRVIWVEHVPIGRWLTRSPLRWPFRWWSRACTVLAVSRFVRDQLVALGVPADRVTVVHPSIAPAPTPPTPRDPARWPSRFVVGTVARLVPEKGIRVLLRALRRLRVTVPHATLVVVGEGPEHAELERLAGELGIAGAVRWAGFQPNVAPWLSGFDCFVLPTVKREAFGIVLLEAMTAGCPVVAPNLGGVPEVVEHGVSGWLVEPDNDGLLAQALLHLYRNPEVALALAARGAERVRERFSEAAMLERLVALLEGKPA